MRNEFTPFVRSTVGFDRLFDSGSNKRMSYRLAICTTTSRKRNDALLHHARDLPRLLPDDRGVVVQESFLSVSAATQSEPVGTLLHRGIANRSFSRRFQLADHVRVTGATLENGLLWIDLMSEVPEAKKPRTVKVEARTPALLAKAA